MKKEQLIKDIVGYLEVYLPNDLEYNLPSLKISMTPNYVRYINDSKGEGTKVISKEFSVEIDFVGLV